MFLIVSLLVSVSADASIWSNFKTWCAHALIEEDPYQYANMHPHELLAIYRNIGRDLRDGRKDPSWARILAGMGRELERSKPFVDEELQYKITVARAVFGKYER